MGKLLFIGSGVFFLAKQFGLIGGPAQPVRQLITPGMQGSLAARATDVLVEQTGYGPPPVSQAKAPFVKRPMFAVDGYGNVHRVYAACPYGNC